MTRLQLGRGFDLQNNSIRRNAKRGEPDLTEEKCKIRHLFMTRSVFSVVVVNSDFFSLPSPLLLRVLTCIDMYRYGKGRNSVFDRKKSVISNVGLYLLPVVLFMPKERFIAKWSIAAFRFWNLIVFNRELRWWSEKCLFEFSNDRNVNTNCPNVILATSDL